LEHLVADDNMAAELQKHHAGEDLHKLDCLYTWACEWVFGMRTDQQTLEATFSRSHTHTRTHTQQQQHTGMIPSVNRAAAPRLQLRS
jgi:hypothetical protein